MNADLQLALSLADEADVITMKFFGRPSLAVKTKSDKTPVSEADEAAERMIRDRLASARPGDAIVGEEFGSSVGRRRWIIDPIDATKNYVRGVPVFATLIALEEDGRLQAGVVSAPAMKRRWWASAGEGAFRNGTRIRVSEVDSVAQAFVGYDSITDYAPHGLEEQFMTLLRRCGRSRGFGDFWAHMLVADGALDVAIEPAVAHWDVAAVRIIVEEAGGRFTTIDGRADATGGSAVSTNGRVHDEVLRMMMK